MIKTVAIIALFFISNHAVASEKPVTDRYKKEFDQRFCTAQGNIASLILSQKNRGYLLSDMYNQIPEITEKSYKKIYTGEIADLQKELKSKQIDALEDMYKLLANGIYTDEAFKGIENNELNNIIFMNCIKEMKNAPIEER